MRTTTTSKAMKSTPQRVSMLLLPWAPLLLLSSPWLLLLMVPTPRAPCAVLLQRRTLVQKRKEN